MGEAKRRAEAYGAGRPWRPALVCPDCKGARCRVSPSEPSLLSHTRTEYGICLDCGTFWEAYPEGWVEEVVSAKPCDNCAFSGGSPESSDREAWLALLASLKAGGEFRCHKGCPIRVDRQAGTAGFDAAWINRRGRVCAGFLRALQNWPDWLEKRWTGEDGGVA